MQYDQPLIPATLIRRYKRFLADVRLISGDEITVHCANTGSMTRCAEPGWRVWLSDSHNPNRKYRYSWEWVEVDGAHPACVNTQRANQLVAEALSQQTIPLLCGYQQQTREPKVDDGRLDFLLQQHPQRADAYVEVKCVTLLRDSRTGLGMFPDAITQRGLKHLHRLADLAAQGYRAVLLFCVAHQGIGQVAPAWDIDPEYSQALLDVAANGVEVLAYGVHFYGYTNDQESSADIPQKMVLQHELPVLLDKIAL